ncbi:MAG: LysE family transporter [Theionarchaea archaeon]|nr:LysE family transporter [Theionarchaea archaeon]MBU7036820.1 LysE family transporter [Theionarchaea archaeon]
MVVTFFIQGFLIGVAIAAPVGPIGLLCIQRTLSEGWISGFVSGMGAATADAVYGCIAGFGVTVVSSFLVSQQMLLRLFGGAFIILLGGRIFVSPPAEKAAVQGGGSLITRYGSTLVLTLTNPMTILSFAAICAGVGISTYGDAGLLVLGVFMGSAVWWFTLSGLVHLVRSRIDQKRMQWINRASGAILMGIGVVILFSLDAS